MMKNYWIIGGVVVVLVAGAIFILQQRNTTPQQSSNKPSVQTATPSEEQGEITVIEVTGTNFKFSPSEIKVKQGDKIKINFIPKGGIHDLVVDGYNVATKQTNSTDTIEFTADKAGTFEYYCSVGNHRQMGMSGKLVVE